MTGVQTCALPIYDFSSDSVLLVLASEHYDAKEYIRDYTAFIEEIHGGA